MSDLPSSRAKIQTEATRFRSAVSESLAQDIGSSINYLIDERDLLQNQVSALQAAGDTYVVTGNGTNQWPGAQNIFSIIHTFTATDYVSLTFGANILGIPATHDLFGGSETTDFTQLIRFPFIGGSSAESFSLQFYSDASMIASASSGAPTLPGDTRIYLTPAPIIFQPGAGSHTIRLYKTGGSIGAFGGKITLRIHKAL